MEHEGSTDKFYLNAAYHPTQNWQLLFNTLLLHSDFSFHLKYSNKHWCLH